MYNMLNNLDRRWVFLAMFLAVAIPVLARTVFPEKVSAQARLVFEAIDSLPPGANVLLSFDFDPASQGELLPMAQAFTRHCCEKGLKQYYMALWPLGPPMIELSIDTLKKEYPELVYGEDYVNFGYKAGLEAVIRTIVLDLQGTYPLDSDGTPLRDIPMTKNIKNIQDMDLIINVSAGDPGTKQWVQFASTPYGITTVSGCTGVQAPLFYPYIPEQLAGVLGAIKGAAEYEAALDEAYPVLRDNLSAHEAKQRMGPQLVAHSLMIVLIVLGNWIFFVGRKRGVT